jgi:hypothetical protein
MKRLVRPFLVYVLPLAIGFFVIAPLLTGCAWWDGFTTPDVASGRAPIQDVAAAAPAAGTLLGGPVGGAIGEIASIGLLAAWAIYQKATEARRHAKHSSLKKARI